MTRIFQIIKKLIEANRAPPPKKKAYRARGALCRTQLWWIPEHLRCEKSVDIPSDTHLWSCMVMHENAGLS